MYLHSEIIPCVQSCTVVFNLTSTNGSSEGRLSPLTRVVTSGSAELHLYSHCQQIFSLGMARLVLRSGSNLVIFLDLVSSLMKIKPLLPSSELKSFKGFF